MARASEKAAGLARTSATSALIVAAERGSRLPWASATRAGAAISVDSLQGRNGAGVEEDEAHVWMPHSVLLVPAQRPLRGSSPGATRRVHGAQPIDG